MSSSEVIALVLGVPSMLLSLVAIASVIYNGAVRTTRVEITANLARDNLVTVGGLVRAMQVDLARLTVRTDVMWGFQIRRGAAESVEKGLADMNSPLKFKPEALRVLDPISDDLIVWGNLHRNLSQADFLLGLEADFGNEMLTRFCIPLKASNGACLLAAMQIALGVDRLNLHLDSSDYDRLLSEPMMSKGVA